MSEKPLILIVDDEPEILKLYGAKLSKSGFDVVTAENGLLGIEAAKQSRQPNLILMDLKMPLMSGVEAFNKLQEDPSTTNIKVIFLTAFSDLRVPEVDAKFASEIGASDFIRKGIDLDELVTKVRDALIKQPTTAAT
jgi:CheY-like chemotaxis protein